MCNITEYKYTCKHRIQHIWSACRAHVKRDKDSTAPACQKEPYLCAKLTTKCGSCIRTEVEQEIRRALSETNEQPTEDFESTLRDQLAALAKQIPTANWRPLPLPVYTRKPGQKRVRTPRKNSLLRNEVKPEDVCGPEAWEGNVVLPVYEAVDAGWNFAWTAETKSLAEELAEDEERRKADMEDGEEDEDGEDDDGDVVDAEGDDEYDEETSGGEDEAEGDDECDEETLGGEDEAEGDEETFGGEDEAEGDEENVSGEGEDEAEAEDGDEEESNDQSPGEPQETTEAEVNEGSIKLRYRFRKTTRGCKTKVRHWELVEVWA